ncbi:hypothetical protein SBA3_5130004 [Candidatus Sulfopaludibacter sp. SbA3]|nr:hypothetical protein SBA3_5130004 [Candidatus Sulfopaludibacter sp. SbA3]
MDKRCEPRFAADQSVAITTLGEHQFQQAAKVKNASGSGLGLVVETEVPPGTALKIEWEDTMVLGEVMYCRPMENSHFLGVQLEQVLRGLRELRQAFDEFYGETQDDPMKTR